MSSILSRTATAKGSTAKSPPVGAPIDPTQGIKYGPYRTMIALCQHVGITTTELASVCRTAELVRTRHVMCWVGHRRFARSLNHMGKILNRDHTSVLHGVRRVDALIAERGLTVPGDPMAAALFLNRELGGVQ